MLFPTLNEQSMQFRILSNLYSLGVKAFNRLRFTASLLLCLMPIALSAQIPDFLRNTSVQVMKEDSYMDYPWAGGMHNPQFSAIDFDNDGIDDLFVFDKINNQIYTFRNNGTPDAVDYSFAPEYARWFPYLHDWALLLDYTQDGLPDIFTYGIAGITVYKTIRLPDNTLTFELASEQLRFNSFSGSLNILSNGSDLPALMDVNNDGDIDVLTFDFIGQYIEYYENQSQELTGTPDDTLWYERITPCWGKFSESSNSNAVNLNDDCGGLLVPETFDETLPPPLIGNVKSGVGNVMNANSKQLHSGSTILGLDLNNDGAKELILGDVSHANLVMLTNGGTPDEAEMTNVDNSFPGEDVPVNLPVFPAAFYLDVNNDGKKDLIAAVNERNNAISANHVWWYQNTGSAEVPQFTYQTNNLMLDNMIDVGLRSYPAWVDVNQDGLLDAVIGNYGTYNLDAASYQASLTVLLNTGTPTQNRFELISNDFGNLLQFGFRGLYPAFGDMDGDTDLDMIAGDELGFLHYFENTAPLGSPMQLTSTSLNFMEVAGADAATPFLFDIDNDGALDLICGERAGKLNYYRNTTLETGTLSFSLVSSFWGTVDVRQLGTPFGYSAPTIAVANSSGQAYLFVNSESGHIHVYTDLTNLVFTQLNNDLPGIREGGRGGIAIADLNNNEGFDLLVGNARGGIGLFSQTGNPIDTTTINIQDNIGRIQTLRVYPSPAHQGAFTLQLPYAAFPQNLKLTIVNLQGIEIQGVAYRQLLDEQLIKVQMPANTPSGLYLLRVITPKWSITLKVMME